MIIKIMLHVTVLFLFLFSVLFLCFYMCTSKVYSTSVAYKDTKLLGIITIGNENMWLKTKLEFKAYDSSMLLKRGYYSNVIR